MKKYFKHFAWLYGLLAILLVINIVIAATSQKQSGPYVRTNADCLTDERVFDYADKLSAGEEEMLRNLIAEQEKKCGCDIVIMTVYDPEIRSLMNYADDFYDENKFGYNKPWGDGCIYVDNWATGDVWFSTCGRVEDTYSNSMIRDIVDETCSRTNADPYKAYSYFVTTMASDMTFELNFASFGILGLVIPLIVSVIYLCVNLANNKGKKTTVSTTYVTSGVPNMRVKQDIFLHKHTTHRTIQSSSGGGGGGHHISSGGISHGGGGGHH